MVHPTEQCYLNKEGFEINKESGIRIMPFFGEDIGGTEGFFISYLQSNGRSN